MAFNGTGTFTRLYNWVTDKTNSTPITVTANIPMASHKFTGLSVGSARTDSITLGQVQDGQFTYLGTTGGAADAYTASPSPVITAYVATMQYLVKIAATNLTTTPYLQISGIGTPASDAVIKKLNASKAEIAVEASDMLINGLYKFQRNSANTAWILLNPEKSYQAFNTNLIKSTTSAYGISYLPSQIIISNNATDTNNDIDFTAGIFNFSDGSGQAVATALTKRLDASWVVGTNQGGLDTGSKANSTWYHCYAIYNPTSLISDFLFSTGATTPTSLPSGYTKYKRVGSIVTNGGGNILAFTQNDKTFTFSTIPIRDINSVAQTNNTETLRTLTCPLGIQTQVLSKLNISNTTTDSGTRNFKHYSPSITTTTLNDYDFTAFWTYDATSGQVYNNSSILPIYTNTASQIKTNAKAANGAASATIDLVTYGWIDYQL